MRLPLLVAAGPILRLLVVLLAGSACSSSKTPPGPDPVMIEKDLTLAERHTASDVPAAALPILDRILAQDGLTDDVEIRARLCRADCRNKTGASALAMSDAQIAELRSKSARRRGVLGAGAGLASEIERVAGDCALLTSDPESARERYERGLAVKPRPKDESGLRFRRWLAANVARDPDVERLKSEWTAAEIAGRPDLIALAARVGVDAGSGATVNAAPAAMTATMIPASTLGGIEIRPRSAWSALPANTSKLDPMTRIFRITVHHSGERTSAETTSDAAIEIKNIQAAHQRGEGYADVGYHFLIDAAGRVWEGRDLKFQGAHAGNAALNSGNVGICLLGDFDQQSLPAPQAKSLVRVLDELRKRYAVKRDRVYGHGEIRVMGGLGGTACPGTRVQAVVENYRRGSTP